MSKLSRQGTIRELVAKHTVASQDELRLLLSRRGHAVTQATLSRDIRELGLVKTTDGYAMPADDGGMANLPSIDRLIRDFVYDVQAAQQMVVLRTSAGAAQPVAAALDAEGWPDVMGTLGGDDTILVITRDTARAKKLTSQIRGLLA
ncbi:MAG TPA: arginine repressor [Candidatus Krumholzibacteria bacterium]|nr:arginine repressor [Candidatus Krumholzibacteria bacterium]